MKIKHQELRCLVVGRYDTNPSGIDDRKVKKLIKQGIIEFFNEQDDIRPFIAQSSVVVLPSYHEGRPKILLEAMAMGRPLITSNVPGCHETVEHGENGYLVKVSSAEDLAAKMKDLIKDPGLLKKMGQKSIEIARSQYDVDKINRNILSCISL